MIKSVQRLLSVIAAFHVDAHERLELARSLENVLHVRDAKLLVDIESHRRELYRDICVELPFLDAIEDADILSRGFARFTLVSNAFAEEIERRRDSLCIEFCDSVERSVQSFARNKSRGESFGHSIVSDEAEDFRLCGEVEKCAA